MWPEESGDAVAMDGQGTITCWKMVVQWLLLRGPEQGMMARGFLMHLPEFALTYSHRYYLRLDQWEAGEVWG